MTALTKAALAYYGGGIIFIGVALVGLTLVVYNICVPRHWHAMALMRLFAANLAVTSGTMAALLVLIRRQM